MNSINSISQQILAKLPLYRLKDLIRAVRACKTAAEERAVIQKESANIRTSFKNENVDTRHANVAKLLYIHMLGYPAHFGQMECLKLVASPKFADKRLGYLGIMLLIDEKTEVLTLVTNSLKNDLNHNNMYIVGLALCTLGNISSSEMARDLCFEVEKLMGSSNTYIRKKSALCALRIIRRVPELYENFVAKAKTLLTDRNHGVLTTGMTLVTEICQLYPESLSEFTSAVPVLVKLLENLTNNNPSVEYDVMGVTDPFLQIKTLRLLRILVKNCVPDDAPKAKYLNDINDILTKIATNTESTKNVGNAILYETVLTIMDIQSTTALRVLAVNILGKFLSNRDNNIRYVALETLNKTVNIETQAVQRHRNTILDCLRDGDISIRRRALELSFVLINEGNIRVLTRELLAFLEIADSEFKQSMTTKLSLAAERFAPNKRWHIDTMLRMLKLAGNFVREEVLAGFIRLVVQTTELHQYTVQKLYAALKRDISQEGLVLAGVWVIGEFGDVLASGGSFEDEDATFEVSESSIIELMNSIRAGPYANQLIREYVLTALMKLSARFTLVSEQDKIKDILKRHTASMEVEIQQRATEYMTLFELDAIRPAVLERMPVPESRSMIATDSTGQSGNANDRVSAAKAGPSDQDLLLDLMRVGTATGGESGDVRDFEGQTSSPSITAGKASPPQNSMDLLAGIFGGATPVSANSPSSIKSGGSTTKSDTNALFDFLGGESTSSGMGAKSPDTSFAKSSPEAAFMSPKTDREGHEAYNKNGLVVTLLPSKDAAHSSVTNIIVTLTNTETASSISHLQFQAAVPKSQRLQMTAAKTHTLSPSTSERQQMRIHNPQGTTIKLRLRISYVLDSGQKVDDIAEYGPFPEGAL